jgi:hypothetical protein
VAIVTPIAGTTPRQGVQIDSDRRRALYVVDRRLREALDEVEK